MKNSILKSILRVGLPIAIAVAMLWWMYRHTDWAEVVGCVGSIHWGWMLLSLSFGVVPLIFRALRWRMALKPMGDNPSARICCDSIFLSYAASLIIPRIGEVTRCGTLRTYAGVSFTRALGTVVTERIVDSTLMILIAVASFLSQMPQFVAFLHHTGFDYRALIARFTSTGWWVTILCCLLAIGFTLFLLFRLNVMRRTVSKMQNFLDGLSSLRHVESLPLYLFYSFGIWAGYYLHFYIAFLAFDFTSGLDPLAGLLIFCVGSFAVLVPTPNGAGPWHFAVKTMLVLYGIGEQPAILFALVVHTIQTALVVFMGVAGWLDLQTSPIPSQGGGNSTSPH